MGTGCFFGAVPEGLKPQLTGIELDFISGTIARQLYPDADIRIQGFEDFTPTVLFDAVLSATFLSETFRFMTPSTIRRIS